MRNTFRLVNGFCSAYRRMHIADKIPHMTNNVQNRIKILLEHMGINPQRASLDAGMSKDALRSLFRKPDAKPSMEMLEGLNRAYDVSIDWLVNGGAEKPVFDADERSAREKPETARPAAPATGVIPIRGSVAASYANGEAGMNDSVAGEIPMPPTLAHIKGIYALYVEGSSMEPQYFPGDLIFLNPARPARAGDCVVVITDHGTGPQRSLGIYQGETADTVKLKKRDPTRQEGTDIIIPKKHIVARHKVLTINEIFGA